MVTPREKRLAAVITVVEEKRSIRIAAMMHGVAKDSVLAWVKRHHDGVETIAMLRRRGVVPSVPLHLAPRERFWRKGNPVMEKSVTPEIETWDRERGKLLAAAEAERATIDDRIAELVARRQLVDQSIEKLKGPL